MIDNEYKCCYNIFKNIQGAKGDGLSYRWFYANEGSGKFTETKSFKTAAYQAAMNASRSGRRVYCVVTDRYGNSVTTETVTLTMSLRLETQPVNGSAHRGEKATVTTKATGKGLTYQWYFANKGSEEFTLTTSFKTATYSLTMNDSRSGRQVYYVITDKYGNTVTTDIVTISMT